MAKQSNTGEPAAATKTTAEDTPQLLSGVFWMRACVSCVLHEKTQSRIPLTAPNADESDVGEAAEWGARVVHGDGDTASKKEK